MFSVTGLLVFDAAGAALELELDCSARCQSQALQPRGPRREARRAG